VANRLGCTFSIFGRVLGQRIGKLLGVAFGIGITKNIEDAYRYLMDNFEPGDRLYLFGFSRGAFAVRCLAGMLHKVGLLQKGSGNLVPYASKIYNTLGNDTIAAGFKTPGIFRGLRGGIAGLRFPYQLIDMEGVGYGRISYGNRP
jgi:Uncharacterized alpha/beta hydrolase domain (DUF2235)